MAAMPHPMPGSSTARVSKPRKAATHAGFDTGKLVKGRKRHILAYTGGLLFAGIIHEASIQDRQGVVLLIASMRGLCLCLSASFIFRRTLVAALQIPVGAWRIKTNPAMRDKPRLIFTTIPAR